MRLEVKAVLAVIITIILCCVVFGAYTMYTNMQEQNQKLNESLNQVQNQLNQTQNNTTNTTDSSTSKSSDSSSSSSSKSSASSGSSGGSNKVTYEEAGVNKNIGYMKTCKYAGCGYVYDSRLSYCPKCGQKNIYV